MSVTVPAAPVVVTDYCGRGHYYVKVDGTWVCCRCHPQEGEHDERPAGAADGG